MSELRASRKSQNVRNWGVFLTVLSVSQILVLLIVGQSSAIIVALLGAVFLVSGVLSIPRTLTGDMTAAAIGAVSFYCFVVFGMRLLILRTAPELFRPSLGLGAHQLWQEAAEAAAIGMLGGTILLFCLWSMARQRRWSPRLLRVGYSPKALLAVLILAFGAGLATTLFFWSNTGGLAAAIGNARVLRVDLGGEFAALIGVFMAGGAAITGLALWRLGRRPSKMIPAIVLVLLATAALTGLLTASRGTMVPPLLAAGAVWLATADPQTSRNLRRSVAIATVALASMVILVGYGAYKSTGKPVGASIAAGDVVVQVRDAGQGAISTQVEELDAFVVARTGNRDQLAGGDVAWAALSFPLQLLPADAGLPKPVPYDYALRAAAFGGTPQTGFPASFFGELWLMGGVAAVVLGSLIVGLSVGALLSRPQTAPTLIAIAWIVGYSHMFLSRPLSVSLSRLLASFGVSIVTYYVAVRGPAGGGSTRVGSPAHG